MYRVLEFRTNMNVDFYRSNKKQEAANERAD